MLWPETLGVTLCPSTRLTLAACRCREASGANKGQGWPGRSWGWDQRCPNHLSEPPDARTNAGRGQWLYGQSDLTELRSSLCSWSVYWYGPNLTWFVCRSAKSAVLRFQPEAVTWHQRRKEKRYQGDFSRFSFLVTDNKNELTCCLIILCWHNLPALSTQGSASVSARSRTD